MDEEGYDIDTEHVRAEAMEPMRRRTRGKPLTDEECDAAFVDGKEEIESDKQARIREYETSPEQREFEGHDNDCEAEFITEAGQWSPCHCGDSDAE